MEWNISWQDLPACVSHKDVLQHNILNLAWILTSAKLKSCKNSMDSETLTAYENLLLKFGKEISLSQNISKVKVALQNLFRILKRGQNMASQSQIY